MLFCYLPLIHSQPLTYAHLRNYAFLPYHHIAASIPSPLPPSISAHHHPHHRPFAGSKQVSSTGKIGRSSSAWSSSDQTSHLYPLHPTEPSRLGATIINIMERTRGGGGGGGHAGNRRESATPVLVTVVTLLLFTITIATLLASGGQDVAGGRRVTTTTTTESTQSYFYRQRIVTVIILLTLRSLTLYIYGAPILDVSRSHTTTQHSR